MKTKEKFIGFDALKQSVSMVQVLDHYGLLDRLHRSGDSLSGACPIHAGHNKASFRVSTSRNCWICFGACHAGGSIIDFVSRKEGVGIREAALLIQDWFHVQSNGRSGNGRNGHKPPHTPSAPAPQPPEGENRPLGFALEHLDHRHPYLAERGLSQETIDTFGLGYCTRGVLAGWIAIPIHNAGGQLVAYAGRWPGTPPDAGPKYKLPKGFRKSLELFNLHRATVADRNLPLAVVEGLFACMKIWQAGHRRVVSSMGSMLSERQAELIATTVGSGGRVLVMFDEDEAGRKGRAEALRRLSQSVKADIVSFGSEGVQPDGLSNADLLRLLQ